MGQRQTLGMKVKPKLEIEEEKKPPNHKFKTGHRSQNEL